MHHGIRHVAVHRRHATGHQQELERSQQVANACVTLEAETGSVNVIVCKSLRERQRSEMLYSRLMAVYGVWLRDVDSGGELRYPIAKRLVDVTALLATQSREFH